MEIIGANKNGQIFVFHHDGNFFDPFPTTISGNIESSPAIGDIDNDGDYEIAIATTMGLKAMDIKRNLAQESHGRWLEEIDIDLVRWT